MEEKKATKVGLSTVFLIVAIIAICIMGYFLYDSKTKENDMVSKEKELNAQIAKLEEDVATEQTQTNSTVENSLIFSSLSGIYVGDAKVESGTTPNGETEVKLYLYEDGSFIYNDEPGLGSGHIGYYTFNDNNLILHEILDCANDVGRTITNDTITLKINSDNSLTDSKLNAKLKKTSQKIENKKDIISTELKNALDNDSLQ